MLSVLENPLMVDEMNDFSPIRELISPLLKDSLKEKAEVDEERVAFLKNEIQKGNYQISNDKIAQALLGELS